jgi:gas vesicle protein
MTNESRTISAAHFLLGLAAGGAIALLVAPCSGIETRKMLKSRVDEGKSKLAEGAEQIKQKSTELYGQAEEAVGAGKTRVMNEMNRIESAFQAGRAAYKRGAVEA